MAIRLISWGAVRNCDPSATGLQILVKHLFQRIAYKSILSIASTRELPGRSVTGFPSIRSRFAGSLRSVA